MEIYRQLLKDIREKTSKQPDSSFKPNDSSNSVSLEPHSTVLNNSDSLGSVGIPAISKAILSSIVTEVSTNNSDVADSSLKKEKKLKGTDKKHKKEKKKEKKKDKKSKKERKGNDGETHSEKRKHDADPEQERSEGPIAKKTKLGS